METDANSVLYLHPNDGSYSISVDKLTGASDYRSWRRSMEIALTSKKKIGFVLGTVIRSTYAADAMKADQWDTCNSMVISWIHACLSDTIKKYVLYVNTARETWVQLEKRSMANGSRKYKLNKDLYQLKQNSNTINEYYTAISSLWEELDSMNALPVISEMSAEFLNGLDDHYAAMRSQMLMLTPLPTVESACSMLQQEESQREVLISKVDTDISAMYSRQIPAKPTVTCSHCGGKGHNQSKCWYLHGFPKKQDKPRLNPVNTGNKERSFSQSWNNNKFKPKMAAAAQLSTAQGGNITLTSQQFEQLLKHIPSSSTAKGSETDEELDNSFSGMVSYNHAESVFNGWIIDSGASDHMTYDLSKFTDPEPAVALPKITLPTGDSASISHTGNVNLCNSLNLHNVLCVPKFRYNLLSVPKLIKDSQCEVSFYGTHCVIRDILTKKIKGVGKVKNGLYYLVNQPLGADLLTKEQNIHTCLAAQNEPVHVPFDVWHHKLGHAYVKKLHHIPCVKKTIKENS
uniref:Retrovirus-related Pol polyprotein from transposon TNT 1-94-like beta-barrel domain-containing protein n=1 Tax=Chenopodium quinoa TaxID=63459 RepID=A0A803N939_CHEQI